MKIADLIDQYELGAKLRGVAPTQLMALRPVRFALGNVPPGHIGPLAVHGYVSQRRLGYWTNCHSKRPAANGTIRRELGALSAVLNWAHQKRLLQDAPPTIDLPPCSPPREVFLTVGEADALFEYAASYDGAAGLFTCLALDTWARANAIETLPGARVNCDLRQIDYRDPSRPETAKRRVPVPISTRLLLALYNAPGAVGDELVVGPITQYAWKKFIEAAGFPHITRHDLRRTGISNAVARGVDLMKVAQMAGDDYGTILKHYARFAPDYLEGVVT